MADRPVLYLIDGHAVAYRQYFAMARAPMTTSTGEPTAAIWGFTRTLLDLFQNHHPHYLAVSLDRGLSGREEAYSQYKATREKMPDDLVTQMERIEQVIAALNIPLMALEGYEADDVIGTIARQAVAQGVDVYIITGDRDILQLLSEHVRVQLPSHKGPDRVYDSAAFRERYGLEPQQLIDLKALMGDSSDNIPGVKGIGEKTATTLLQTYGSLDEVYANLASIKGAVGQKLTDGREMAYLSRMLATIRTDLPITLELPACVARDFDPHRADELFAALEFTSLRQGFRDLQPVEVFNPSADVESIVVDTREKLHELVSALNNAEAIVWDTETTGVDQMSVDLVGIALAVGPQRGYYIPVGHHGQGQGTLFEEPADPQLPLEEVIDALRGPLTNPAIPKYAHNASYDLVMLQRYGIDVTPVAFDTMVAEWMRDPISSNLSLKRFALNELSITMTDISELIGTGKKQITMAQVPVAKAAPYASADAAITYRAVEYLRPLLADLGVEKLFNEIEMPLIPVIAAMERAGAALDVDYLRQMSVRLTQSLKALEEQIFSLSEGYGEFNINSPKQLNEVLFEKLSLPVEGLKKTSQGYSTDITTLEALRDAHPIVQRIMEYRELVKLQGTYVDALPALINPVTGRVHTSYNQTGTSTGRFSSSNPNLQNIPIRTEQGREVRRAFIAPPGSRLLSVDYSQIELRVMAHISEDETLIAAFHEGQDIHRATAAAVNGISPDAVTYEQRSFAKRVNFGLMYGMGAFRLARDSNLTLSEAEGFVKRYFERLPGVERYINETKQLAMEKGFVETLLGRKRFFPALRSGSANNQTIQGELRAAINMPIQGTAADILKIAMLRLYDALKQRGFAAQMILQVHDELVLEVPENELDEVTALVVEIMQNAFTLRVPLVANASLGQNWLDMEDI